MLYQTQSEINTFYVGVIQKVAASPKIAIQDWEMKSTVELLEELKLTNSAVFVALESFLKAYQAWYDVHVEIDKAGAAGSLPPLLSQRLDAAISSRDSTRMTLIQGL